MKAWLICNSYLKSAKFEEIYRLLSVAGEKLGIDIALCGNAELLFPIPDRNREELPDFALFWDKDIPLGRNLEARGLRLFNSAAAVEACDDKRRTQLMLASADIPMPAAINGPMTYDPAGIRELSFLQSAGEILGWPMVIKEAFGSFGMQVHLARSRSEAEQIVSTFGNRPFLMQRFISAAAGRDVRINVVGGKVAACMERRSRNGDFRSNATLGGIVAPADPPESAKRLAVRAVEVLGLDFAGVDVLFDDNGAPMICEVNSNPHFATTLAATGVDLAPLILQHCREKTEAAK
ncbi:MAG: RimK family alpha-L-glutamate ligase [Clostridia bacterium]|nr:RimK family alpha-L-glutamate ligase [Clostridia bacterium]